MRESGGESTGRPAEDQGRDSRLGARAHGRPSTARRLYGLHLDSSHLDSSHLDHSHVDSLHLDSSHLDSSHLDISHLDISHPNACP
jgi:hypothetical protein